MDSAKSSSPTPHLVQRQAFEEVLANYRISQAAQRVLDKVKLVLLGGPSASGRNTVIEQLTASGKYRFIVSDTTRPPRVNDGVPEQSGREYWFRTEAEMLDELRRGEFLEAEIIHKQQVSGMSIRELQKTIDEHKIAINEVEIGGFQNVLNAKPDTVAILLLPPSYEEWQRRMGRRGQMAPSETRNRMETAAQVFTAAIHNDKAVLVINKTVEQATAEIDRIVRTGGADPGSQQGARLLAKQLLSRVEQALAAS